MTWPGEPTVIIPPQAHEQVDVLSSAGTPPIFTNGEPGIHEPVGAGMHGCGVKTPRAALVAAMTCGFAGDMQIAKPGMFAGVTSVISPA
ncbi:MAG TPA: hypothetical protein VG265_12910, partial [Gaiellaceae bacterium]|nr:hypothetical protein [Gaiellaceae bacterium]